MSSRNVCLVKWNQNRLPRNTKEILVSLEVKILALKLVNNILFLYLNNLMANHQDQAKVMS